MAQAGSRVCLIEADLRRPKVLEYMGLEGGVGLTDALIGRTDVIDVIQPYGGTNLWVLGAGPIPPNPSELLGSTAIWFYTTVVPLSDPLKSVWLVIHVFVASLATALFALAFALSVTQLLQARRERLAVAAEEARGAQQADAEASTPADTAPAKTGARFLRTLPSADALESLAYRFAIIGFIFWTFTLIAGSIWAYDAWGRYWGFDTKEVWTFVIWVLYAGYIHARATRGWRGTRSAWLSIVGFAAVMFNFTIVNMFFKGLHVYSGLN